MNPYLPFRPPKNEAFRLYLGFTRLTPSQNASHPAIASGLPNTVFISKDSGPAVSSTNSLVNKTHGMIYIDLTADEMNADTVQFAASKLDTFGGGSQVITIYTDDGTGQAGGVQSGGSSPVGSTTFSPAVITSIVKTIDKGYSMTSFAVDDGGFNYYGLTSTTSKWWLIIRETADFEDVGYAMNYEPTMAFIDGWANKVSLSYSPNFPLNRL